MLPAVWNEPFRVRSYEIGPDALLTLPHLCDWLQEAAGAHATALGVATDRLLEVGRAWVLTRLQVRVERYPRWREDVSVETWPSAADGLFAQRDFVLTDAGGEGLARATSQWLVIDVARRRPVRLPREVLDLPRAGRSHALAPSREGLPEPEASSKSCRFSVRRADLDLNEHVNNVRYVEWALEAVPEGAREAYQCTGLEVQFRAEALYGDTVESACAWGAGTALHRVSHAGDGRTLASARTQWAPAGERIFARRGANG